MSDIKWGEIGGMGGYGGYSDYIYVNDARCLIDWLIDWGVDGLRVGFERRGGEVESFNNLI